VPPPTRHAQGASGTARLDGDWQLVDKELAQEYAAKSWMCFSYLKLH
jgi:hypothetical protein